jgi:hypothetical protein
MRLLVVLALAGCTQPPAWHDERTDLDRVALSVWTRGGDLFVVGGPRGTPGQGLFLRRDGAGWHEAPVGSSATLWWVFGFSDSDVWAVGDGSTLLHWDGAVLTPQNVVASDATLFGVWGVSDDDLWVVGGHPDVDGLILHRSGGAWSQVMPPKASGSYFKVWGTATDDVYICGQSGTILHWDGRALVSEPTGLMPFVSLFTVAGRSRDDLYAVGGLGNAVALHRSGGVWSPVADKALAEAPDLAGVAVSADGTLMLVGTGGTKLRGMPGALRDETGQASPVDLHATVFDGSRIWAVGGNYNAPAPATRHGVIERYGD